MHARQGLRQVAIALVGDDDAAAGLGDQEIGAGDADIGGEELLAAAWCAPRSGCRGVRGRRGRSAGRCAARGSSASQSSRFRWKAGAMMWLGGSWRSWMMYSPRSVSTGAMPWRLQMVVDPELLGDHRLALGDGPGAGRAGRSPARRRARPRPWLHQCTLPPARSHVRRVGLQVEVEIGQRVVLDVARRCRAAARTPAERRRPAVRRGEEAGPAAVRAPSAGPDCPGRAGRFP